MTRLHIRRRIVGSMITRALCLVFIGLACVFDAASYVVQGDPGVTANAERTPPARTQGAPATLGQQRPAAPLVGRATFTKTRVRSSGRDVAGFSARPPVEEPATPTAPAGPERVDAEAWPRMAELPGSVGAPRLASFYPARYGEPFIVEGNGVRVAVTPLGGAPVSVDVASGEVVYRQAYAETDSRHVVSAGRSEEFLELRSAAAPRRFEYEVSEVGAGTRVEMRDGAVHFTNAAGVGVEIEAPWVQEPGGEKRPDVVRWEMLDTAPGEKPRLSLILTATGLHYPLIIDPSWTPTGGTAARERHTATKLADGRVLIVGGFLDNPQSSSITSTAAIYDPLTGTWSDTGSMNVPRWGHTATLLADGRVLVAGGIRYDSGSVLIVLDSAELFDPLTGTWSFTGTLPTARDFHSATLLPNGNVLIAGSHDTDGGTAASLYDPATGTWRDTGRLTQPFDGHSATLLSNGKVLVAGGAGFVTTELYDPALETWTPTGNLNTPRLQFTTTLLLDGRVLVAGGRFFTLEDSAELYDPATGTWSATGSLNAARLDHAATILASGRVVVVGGSDDSGVLTPGRSVEIYDPMTGTWTETEFLLDNRTRHTATLLDNRKVLVAGGHGDFAVFHSDALLFEEPNHPPTANAGPDQFVEATSPSGAAVTLDGTASSDPNLDTLSYAWKEGASLLGATAQLTLPAVAFGLHTFTLTVDDGRGGVASDSVDVTVRDTLAPTIAITSPTATTYTFAQAVAASFACTDVPSGVASCVGTAPNGANIDTSSVGSHDFTVTATDLSTSGTPGGNMSSITLSYSVVPAPSVTTVTCPPSQTYTGAPLTPCTVTVTGAGGLSLTPTATYTNNLNVGTAGASYTYPGDVNHTGSSDAKTFTITSASTTTAVTSSLNPSVAGNLVTFTATVSPGASGMPTGSVTFTDNGTPIGTATPLSDGKGSVSLSLTAAGGHTIEATYSGDGNFTGSTGSVAQTVTVGPVNAGTSTVVAAPTSVTADGITTSTVTVTLKDAFLNPVSGKAVTLGAGSGKSTITTVSGTTNASGLATFTVKDTVAQTVTYTATDAADSVTVTQTAMVTFTVGPVSAITSTVVAVPTSVIADGVSTSTITVTLRDATGNPVSGKTVTLGAGGGGSVISPASGSTNASGQVAFTAKDAVAQVVTYTATDTTDTLTVTQTATVTFTAGPVTAGTSTVVAVPTSVTADGIATATITVTLKDATNNPVSGKTVTLAAGSGSSTITTVTGTTNASGQATFAVKDAIAQAVTYTATDSTDGVTVTQTATVTFSAGAVSAGTSTVVAVPTSVTADGIATSTITVTLKDATNNPVSGKRVMLAAGSGSSTITTVSGTTNASGQAAFTVKDAIAQAVTYTATDTTDTLTVTQTATVTFGAGAVTAGTSTVVAVPTSVTADGVATATITVTLKDATSNPVSGKTVTLGAGSGSSTITTVSGTTNASGQATFTVKDAVVQAVTYTATDSTDGVTVTQTATVTFSAGAVSAGTSTVVAVPTSVTADGIATSTITVTLKDATNNPVSSKTVTLAAGSGSSTITTVSGTTNASGQVTFAVKDAIAQAVTYTATDTTDTVTVTQTATVTFTAAGGGGPTAVFVRGDTSTQGNWKGAYGSQGAAIINDSANYPAYASVSTAGIVTYTWDGAPADGRALQRAATGRIASCWCAGTFAFDVNLTDGQAHQVALYALDWDNRGRAERVDILAFGTTTVLDTRTLTGFNGGQYLVWTLSGHVTIRVTLTGGPNAVVSGLFFDGGGPGGPAAPTVVTGAATGATTTGATLAGTVNPNGVGTTAFFQYGTTTSYTGSTGPTSVGAGTSAVPVTMPITGLTCGTQYHFRIVGQSSAGTSFGLDAQFNTAACPGGPSAVFVLNDPSTRGNWKGVYGSQGAAIVNDTLTYPSFAPVTVSTNVTWTWASSTTDARALQRAATGRIAACWCASTFDFDVNITDGQAHQAALYAIDWDNIGRAERIDVLAFGTTNVLDTRTLTNFGGGQYLVWTLSGHVTIRVTLTAGANAVVSGLFFDGGSTGGPTVVTGVATGATLTGATLNGTVNPNGLATTASFQYGTTTGYGASTSPVNVGSGTSAVPFNTPISGLTCGTQYHFRAVGQSSAGTSFGLDAAFNTAACPGGGPSAVFVRNDSSTQGNWKGVYGHQGAAIINDVLNYPAYAQVTSSTNVTWTWDSAPADGRALQRAATGRIAACWCNTTFTFDINVTDGQTHQIALYGLDWDSRGRAERVDVNAFGTNALLDTRTLSNFSGGQYLVWTVSGHVTITITATGGPNAVVSGLFFDSNVGGASLPEVSEGAGNEQVTLAP